MVACAASTVATASSHSTSALRALNVVSTTSRLYASDSRRILRMPVNTSSFIASIERWVEYWATSSSTSTSAPVSRNRPNRPQSW